MSAAARDQTQCGEKYRLQVHNRGVPRIIRSFSPNAESFPSTPGRLKRFSSLTYAKERLTLDSLELVFCMISV